MRVRVRVEGGSEPLAKEGELGEVGRREGGRAYRVRRAVVARAVLAVGREDEEGRRGALQLGACIRDRLAVWAAVVVGALAGEPDLEGTVTPPDAARLEVVQLCKHLRVRVRVRVVQLCNDLPKERPVRWRGREGCVGGGACRLGLEAVEVHHVPG